MPDSNIPLATTENFPGVPSDRLEYVGLVSAVCYRDARCNMVNMMKEAATDELQAQAGKLKANAILGLRLEITTEAAPSYTTYTVMAYGTAVRIHKPLPPASPSGQTQSE